MASVIEEKNYLNMNMIKVLNEESKCILTSDKNKVKINQTLLAEFQTNQLASNDTHDRLYVTSVFSSRISHLFDGFIGIVYFDLLENKAKPVISRIRNFYHACKICSVPAPSYEKETFEELEKLTFKEFLAYQVEMYLIDYADHDFLNFHLSKMLPLFEKFGNDILSVLMNLCYADSQEDSFQLSRNVFTLIGKMTWLNRGFFGTDEQLSS